MVDGNSYTAALNNLIPHGQVPGYCHIYIAQFPPIAVSQLFFYSNVFFSANLICAIN